MATVNAGRGYFEDRRPAANMDPYQVCAILIETICSDGEGSRRTVETAAYARS
jgi:glutamine synthetase